MMGRWLRHARTDERGAVTSEMAVVMVTFFAGFLMLVVFAGRVGQAENDVRSAAHEAARAATLEGTPEAADARARDVVASNLAASGIACAGGITTDVRCVQLRPWRLGHRNRHMQRLDQRRGVTQPPRLAHLHRQRIRSHRRVQEQLIMVRRVDWRSEQGSVTIFVAVLGLSFLMAAGLAIDGARKLGGLSEARDLADNAARTCAQGVDLVAFRATGIPNLNPVDAPGRADMHLATTGNTGTVSIRGTECTVTVTLSISTRFLPGPYVVSATESAQALVGVGGATP